MTLKVQVFLEGPEGTKPRDTTYTENVSAQGVGVLTRQLWRAEEELWIIVARTGWRRRGRVAYCLPREDGRFRVGIGWESSPIDWTELAPEAVAS